MVVSVRGSIVRTTIPATTGAKSNKLWAKKEGKGEREKERETDRQTENRGLAHDSLAACKVFGYTHGRHKPGLVTGTIAHNHQPNFN